MNHRKQARNHPAADVGVGIGSAMMGLGVLTRAVRDDSFWGTLFALLFLAAMIPWTIKAMRYAVRRRPDNSDSNGGRPVIAVDLTSEGSTVVTGVRAPDGTVTIQGITREAPPVNVRVVHMATPGPGLSLFPRWDQAAHDAPFDQDASPVWSPIYGQPKVDALSYDGDPRLSPGFWEKEDGESEADYWRRLCGHDDTVPGHRHMLTCPDWVPGQI